MKTSIALQPDFFSSNRARLRQIFDSNGPIVICGNGLIQQSADATYPFRQDSNFWYLTGLTEPNLVLVMDGKKEYIIEPNIDPVRSTFDGTTDRNNLAKSSGIDTWYDENLGWEKLTRRIKKTKHLATLLPPPAFIKVLGMYSSPARATLLAKIKKISPDLDIIDLRSQFASMRAVKQPQELDMMRTAIKQTEDMFKLIEQQRPWAVNEYELMAVIEKWRVMNQASYAYDPIIASGKNGLTLHYHDNNAPIDPGSFLLMDIGASYGGYSADVTRSVATNPSRRQTEVYEAVLAVHKFACSLLKPGTSLVAYEDEVMQYMGQKLLELGLIKEITKEHVREFYPHSTSHFVGIDTHDVGDYKAPLTPGVVLTVEPGIYIAKEDIAIRLEDMILITKNGNLNMTDHIPKTVDRL